ncbi:hypothetical protein OSTOST_10244, partial [Ostertagia ostertagi]
RLRWVLYSAIVSSCFAVKCYDCYDTGPDHAACTKERSCTGLACMIFDAGDGNNTMTAFCLLAMKDENIKQNAGCWLEPDGRGRHCMCYTDFCNRLVNKSKESEKPIYTANYPNAQKFLKHTSFWQLYKDHNGRLFASKVTESRSHARERSCYQLEYERQIQPNMLEVNMTNETDLVPIDFAEYDRVWHERNEKEITTRSPQDKIQERVQDVASSARLPSWMLMTM